MFRNRTIAAVAVATGALLVALEMSDALAEVDTDDDVRDGTTSAWFGAAMATAIAGSIVSIWSRRPMPQRRAAWWSGLGLVWSGAAVNRLARRQLGAHYRSRVTVVSDHEVIRTGLYRHVRHPMYSGSTMICAGIATAVAAPASALWCLPVLALVHRIDVEEAALAAALGDDYDDYREGRPRLVPKPW